MIRYEVPILGFCAHSGTGKTTLLRQLLPVLKQQGLRVGMVKHAHHSFDIDHHGKDSYELRKAGADQMSVASRQRIAFVMEAQAAKVEPSLEDALAVLIPSQLDLVLVEGFKQAAIPKIELHRSALGKPLFYPNDKHIIAVASDTALPSLPTDITPLDINRVDEIADFVLHFCLPDMKTLTLP
ncbi:MAG: molybdopterin-guanine dinucleotide biosynthesis protein B [Gammaproteobacteria bacterium]|nr:molybdopterin-guanine dinucleotide biosynthesis protein B [Gammaproteobacteria bacterium]